MAQGIKVPTSPSGWIFDLMNAIGMKAFVTSMVGFASTMVAYGFNYLVSRYPAEAQNIAARIMNTWQRASGAWVLFAKSYMEQLTGETFSDDVIQALIGNKLNLTANEMSARIGKEFLAPMFNMIMPGTPDWNKIRADANLPESAQYAPVKILNPSDGLLGAERFLGVNLQFQLQAWMLHFIGDTVSMGSMKSLKDLPNAISWSYGIGWLSWLVMGTPFQITIADPLRKLLNMLYRPTTLTTAQAIDAWKSGYIDDETFYGIMREAGYPDNLIPTLVNQGTQRFSMSLLHDSYLTGRTDWNTVARELQRSGFDEMRIGYLKTIWELERHDDLLKKWASECIDSFEKGFIKVDELRKALQTAGWEDVEIGSPIDLQIEISKQKREKQGQFTKSEVQTLWKQCRITEDSALTFLTRTGMTEFNAKLLLDAWKGGLIERDIQAMYKAGVIADRDKVIDYLEKIGIQPEQGNELLKLWDTQLAAKARAREHVLTKYELRELLDAGAILPFDAQIGLENLGWDTTMALYLVRIWQGKTETTIDKLKARITELENPIKTLTQSEVKQLFDKGLMNLQAVYQYMRNSGYTDGDALLMTQLYTGATIVQIRGIVPYTPSGVEPRALTVAQIQELYEAGAPGFDTQGALERMKGIGYSEPDALLLLALWTPYLPVS